MTGRVEGPCQSITSERSFIDGIYPAQFNGYFTYAVQTASGASAPGLNPAQNLALTGVDASLTTGTTERYGGNVSVDWRPRDDLSGYLRLTYAKTKVEQDSYYSQIYGNNIGSAEIGTTGLYQPVIGDIKPRCYYETNPEDAMLGTFQVGGAAKFGRLHLAPNAFVSYGENNEPNHFEISARLPEVADGFPFGGSSLFTASDKGPIPILSAAELAQVGDIGAYGAPPGRRADPGKQQPDALRRQARRHLRRRQRRRQTRGCTSQRPERKPPPHQARTAPRDTSTLF